MKNNGEFRDWSNIPTDLLEQFYKRLEMPDQLALSAVCKQWNSSTTNKPHLSSMKNPWLIYDYHGSHIFHIYTLIGTRRSFEISKPFRPVHGSTIISSSKSWLFMKSQNELFIINIFSSHRIDLPSLTTIPDLLKSPREASSVSNGNSTTPLGFAISTCSNQNPINVVALTKEGDIVWCKITDNAWKGHRGTNPYGNMTFHDGKLFAVSKDGSKIDIFHVESSSSSSPSENQMILMRSIDSPNLSTQGIQNELVDFYLVESKGSLFIIKRFYSDPILRKTDGFNVFKLENDHVVAMNGPRCFDGHSLFMSIGLSCESVDLEKCPELIKNQIYFIGNSGDGITAEFGVSIVSDRLVLRANLPNTIRYQPPVWVMPRIAFGCECSNHDLKLWKTKIRSSKRKIDFDD